MNTVCTFCQSSFHISSSRRRLLVGCGLQMAQRQREVLDFVAAKSHELLCWIRFVSRPQPKLCTRSAGSRRIDLPSMSVRWVGEAFCWLKSNDDEAIIGNPKHPHSPERGERDAQCTHMHSLYLSVSNCLVVFSCCSDLRVLQVHFPPDWLTRQV